MVRRTIRTSAALGGGSARPLARRSFGKPAAWVGVVAALFCALISIVPAAAQVANICSSGNCTASSEVSVGGTAITTNTTLSGTLNGNGGQGFFVANGATLTVNN